MEVGEDDLAGAHVWPLDRQRLLDLDDQVGVFPDLFGAGANVGTMDRVLIVIDAASLSGPGLIRRINRHLAATNSGATQHPGGSPLAIFSAACRVNMYTLPSRGFPMFRSPRYCRSSRNFWTSNPTCVIA